MASCNVTYLREPVQMDLEAMGNALLTLSINLWTDLAHTLPYDLTGYTARGALKNRNLVTDIHSLTCAITQTSDICNVTGTLAKSTVENLIALNPYIYDLSVDNSSTGDSFVLWTGIIVFQMGASS